MPAETPTIPPPRLLIDADEFARLLSVHRGTLHRMRSRGAIGPREITLSGHCIRFDLAEVEAWIAARCPGRAEWQQERGLAGAPGPRRVVG